MGFCRFSFNKDKASLALSSCSLWFVVFIQLSQANCGHTLEQMKKVFQECPKELVFNTGGISVILNAAEQKVRPFIPLRWNIWVNKYLQMKADRLQKFVCSVSRQEGHKHVLKGKTRTNKSAELNSCLPEMREITCALFLPDSSPFRSRGRSAPAAQFWFS